MRLARNISSSHNANGNMSSNYTPGQPCQRAQKGELATCNTLARAPALPTRSQPKYSYSCMATVLVQLSSTCGDRRHGAITRSTIHVVA